MLTYMHNLGRNPNKPVCFIHKDIRTIKGSQIKGILKKLGYKTEIDIVHGSPPCQDWSSANAKQKNLPLSLESGRRYCMLEYVRMISELKPKIFTMENVTGLIQGKLKVLFEQFLNLLRNLGYDIEWQVLNALDYGVPQNRKRVFVVGYKSKINSIDELFLNLKNYL